MTIPEGLTRQPDRDNRSDTPEENSWEYVTDDGYRVVRISGQFPWLVFSPVGARQWRSTPVSNLTRAMKVIEESRRDNQEKAG